MDKEKQQNIETENETEQKETASPKDDWLKFKLENPVDYQQIHLEELDLNPIRDLNGNDMNVIYDIYASLGGDGYVMQETTLRFAQVAASRATGVPMELLGMLSAKDTIKLKNRIYRFFYLSE